jgi:hydroxyquinol 1,2-dioxygenase
MRNLDQHTITEAVVERLADAPNARVKAVLTSLVRHLHAFAMDVKLTEDEWMQGIEFLTACGKASNPKRQEVILLSDTLGLSMLVVAMNHDQPAGCTESTVFGPFHVEGAPHYGHGENLGNGAVGVPCTVHGRVLGHNGQPVAGAVIDVWQADAEGLYDVQHTGLDKHQARGVLVSGADGAFHFKSIVPKAYPIPDDGPVGDMLRASGRHPWRPAHIHFMVKAAGYQTLVTHVFRSGDPYLDSDAVFGVRDTLIGDWARQTDGTYRLDFDLVLHPLG